MSADGTSTNTITPSTTSTIDVSVTPSIVTTTNQNDFCYLVIGASINHSTIANLEISNLKITYKW